MRKRFAAGWYEPEDRRFAVRSACHPQIVLCLRAAGMRAFELSMWVFAAAIPFAGFSPSLDAEPPSRLRLPGRETAGWDNWPPAETWQGHPHDPDKWQWIPSADGRSGRWSATTRYSLLIVRPDPNVHFKILFGQQKSSTAFSIRVIGPQRERHEPDFIQVYRRVSDKPSFLIR